MEELRGKFQNHVATMANRQLRTPSLFVGNTGSSMVNSFMRNAAAGARRVMVCVGCVSEPGFQL